MIAAMPRKTADDMNAEAREFWSRPGPNARQAALARKLARQQQTAAGRAVVVENGAESRERVRVAALKQKKKNPDISLRTTADLICAEVGLSVHHTRQHLVRLGLFSRPK